MEANMIMTCKRLLDRYMDRKDFRGLWAKCKNMPRMPNWSEWTMLAKGPVSMVYCSKTLTLYYG